MCKDGKGKVGVSLFAESKGVFVCYVKSGSPGAIAGLRFGDQILQVQMYVGEVGGGREGRKFKEPNHKWVYGRDKIGRISHNFAGRGGGKSEKTVEFRR